MKSSNAEIIKTLNEWSMTKGSRVRFEEIEREFVNYTIRIVLEDPYLVKNSRYSLSDEFYSDMERVLKDKFQLCINLNFNGTEFGMNA